MRHEQPVKTLGADLRALRKARGMKLQDLADALGRSVGWVSQVERDMSEPSINDLRHMARALDVSVSSLFRVNAAPDEEGLIVRAGARRPIGSRAAGLVEELLSPDLSDDFEVVHSSFAVGAVLEQFVERPTQEVGYIVRGKLDVTIADKTFTLSKGDSFRVKGQPFRWANPYGETCEAVWVIAPPVY